MTGQQIISMFVPNMFPPAEPRPFRQSLLFSFSNFLLSSVVSFLAYGWDKERHCATRRITSFYGRGLFSYALSQGRGACLTTGLRITHLRVSSVTTRTVPFCPGCTAGTRPIGHSVEGEPSSLIRTSWPIGKFFCCLCHFPRDCILDTYSDLYLLETSWCRRHTRSKRVLKDNSFVLAQVGVQTGPPLENDWGSTNLGCWRHRTLDTVQSSDTPQSRKGLYSAPPKSTLRD